MQTQALARGLPRWMRQAMPTFRPSRCLLLGQAPPYSTSADAAAPPTTPPFLARLKTDLKSAMRSKDTARLDVLRSILASVNNASKTTSPIKTNVQLSALMGKMAKGAQMAAEEASANGRADLAEKEHGQLDVLHGYMAETGVKRLEGDELKAVIEKTVAQVTANEGKASQGPVMKALVAEGGPLDGYEVSKLDVSKLVKELIS